MNIINKIINWFKHNDLIEINAREGNIRFKKVKVILNGNEIKVKDVSIKMCNPNLTSKLDLTIEITQ